MTWQAVDGAGLTLATGRPPRPPAPASSPGRWRGAPSPAAALAAAPVASWPLEAVADDGRRVDVAAALGTGGVRVAELLARLAATTGPPAGLDLTPLAASTPAGPVDRPVMLVSLTEAAEMTGAVDRQWLAAVDERRAAPRHALVAAGRGTELEAALHLAMLLATGPVDETAGAVARIASGGRLWLLGGAIAWALTGDPADPFAPWADLVSFGLWPVGPVDGSLVVGR